MSSKSEPHNDNTTLDKIMRVEHRICGTKGDIEGLFENYLADLILLRELRARLAEEMVDDAFPSSSDNSVVSAEENINAE